MMAVIFAIDPGSEKSAVVSFDGSNVLLHLIGHNESVRDLLYQMRGPTPTPSAYAIEMIASYGMPVGKEVFETCKWIGRFAEIIIQEQRITPMMVYRKDVKIHLCGSMKAKDANIRQALIDRIGPQGIKKAPGPTYGIKADEWSALAVAVYAHDCHALAETCAVAKEAGVGL
jgi:hypothetical protein